MHDCQRFREDWIVGLSSDPADCHDCRTFCREAGSVLAALDASAGDQLSEEYWIRFNTRLRTRLTDEAAVITRQSTSWIRWIPAMASAAAIVLAIVWAGFFRNVADSKRQDVAIRFDNTHIEGLDPRVVSFLGQAELDLRNFTKIEPSYTEEIRDARNRASQSLVTIADRKTAAGDFAPVRIALDEYESVLRDIKNLDSPEDIEDVQTRIRRNGLIAKLKAYQPHVVLASTR
jgi:hypothetical protein